MELCWKEDRRAEDAARDAPETFEKNLAKMWEKYDMLEEDTRLIADKMCHASQSNHTQKTTAGRKSGNPWPLTRENGSKKNKPQVKTVSSE